MTTFGVTFAVSNTSKSESLLYMAFLVTFAVSNTGKFECLLYMTFRVTSAVSNTGKFESLLDYMMVFGIIAAVPNNSTKAMTESRFLHTTGSSQHKTMVARAPFSSQFWLLLFFAAAFLLLLFSIFFPD